VREIKFRVWDEKESCMITSPQSVADLIGKAIVGTLEKDRYVFMQHTGMKLANGQEVYEGDIILFDGSEEDGSFGIVLYNALGGYPEFDLSIWEGGEYDDENLLAHVVYNRKDARVIGHCFDAPDWVFVEPEYYPVIIE
jgi:hypothetical protein